MTRLEKDLRKVQRRLNNFQLFYVVHAIAVLSGFLCAALLTPLYLVGEGVTKLRGVIGCTLAPCLLDRGDGIIELLFRPRKWYHILKQRETRILQEISKSNRAISKVPS